jgi:hypothetical protein
MSSIPPEQVEDVNELESRSGRAPPSRRRALPLDLANYLRGRTEALAEAWSAEISAREVGQDEGYDALVGRFTTQLTELIPWLLGPHSSHIRPLWDRTAELFGAMGAKRGLAAGEIIEEFQIVRDLLIRTLFDDPPAEGPISLRDTLRLNRIVDGGVTHASVGHTDALFFQFFEAQDAPLENSPGDVVREAEAQLALVEEELAQILEITPAEATSDDVEN